MGFSKENYKRIKEEYEGKYLRAQEAARLRRAEVHAAIPEIAELDRELAATGFKIFDATLRGDMDRLAEVNAENESLQKQRATLMRIAGFAPDYTEIKYECEACGDTGTVDYAMCKCMRKRLVEASIESSGMSDLIKRQRFDNFDLGYYDNHPDIQKRMANIYTFLQSYAEHFTVGKSGNLALFGGTGLGKTHLSSAVAGKVIEKGNDVYYISAMNLFADFEEKRFGSSSAYESTGEIDQYFTCDLLIIDDLGSEMINQFTVSCLYNIINSRLNHKKPTIISSNLTQDEFRKKYWDRISSRVFGEYLVLPFLGHDIRQQKIR